MDDGLFLRDTYAATRKPLRLASPLPGWCYVSPEWYQREIQTIFRGPNAEWLCVGRGDQVPKPGDFYTIDVLDEPLIVVRDKRNEVHVLSAVCRHRGSVIATNAEGNCKAFVCPYHSWCYDLDGGLIDTPGLPPPMRDVQAFQTDDHGLMRMRSDSWGGFLFVTFNPRPKPLLEALGELPSFLANYRIDEMRFTHRDIYDIDVNWKVWLENAFENYHAPTVHRKHMTPGKPQNWEFHSGDSFEAMYSARSIVAYSGLPAIPGLSEREAGGLYHIWLRPTLQIIVTSSYMKYRQYLPEGPEKLRLIENWSFPRTTVESPEFKETVGPEYYDKYAEIIREDAVINPMIQKGMRSGSYRPGRYSLEEYIVHRIANYVLDRVLGKDERANRMEALASLGD